MNIYLQKIIEQLPISKLIERYCPFTNDELLFLAKKNYDFTGISYNHEIVWSLELINKLKNVLDWVFLSFNGSVPWATVAPQFIKFICWETASINPKFVWHEDYLKNREEEIDWYWLSGSNFPFTEENIFRYRESWDWSNLSSNPDIKWSEELLEHFAHRWDWFALSYNSKIPFSYQLIEKYKDRWSFDLMSMNSKLINDKFLPLLQYFTILDYDFLSSHKVDFTLSFIENHKNKLNWQELSCNENSPWDMELLNRYKNRWHYFEMSGNSKLPWSIDLIEAHENEWNWDGKEYGGAGSHKCLSDNESLPWSFNFIEKYEHKLEWGHLIYESPEESEVKSGMAGVKKLKWTLEKMAKYAHHLHEYFFLENKNYYEAIENEIGRENVFNLYRSLA